MSKGILVVDMPESCSKCKFMYEFYGIKKCHLLNALCNGGKAIIPKDKYVVCRHDECPLVELPEKIPEPKEGYETIEESVKRIGWNACLDKMLGR